MPCKDWAAAGMWVCKSSKDPAWCTLPPSCTAGPGTEEVRVREFAYRLGTALAEVGGCTGGLPVQDRATCLMPDASDQTLAVVC
jgi:hypothetical protein